jgi:Fe-S cluster assembly iron-binding protein IscA
VQKLIPVIILRPGAGRAISAFLAEKHIIQPIRIDLNFTGCCDASLSLRPDNAREEDLRSEVEGLSFIISPDVYDLAGEIEINYVEEAGRTGFAIRSGKPVSEWDGFGICDIKSS